MRKTRYTFRENIERIADDLSGINYSLDIIKNKINIEEQNTKGLSAICQNTYASNLRMDEVIKLIKELYPEEKSMQ